MKKIITLLLAALLALSLVACGEVTLHCDGCGKELQADPKMNEDWIIFCNDCGKDLDFVQ